MPDPTLPTPPPPPGVASAATPGPAGPPTVQPQSKVTLVRRELSRRLRAKATSGNGGKDPYASLSDDDLLDKVVSRYPDSLYPTILAKAMVPDLPSGNMRPGAIPPPTMSMGDSAIATLGNVLASPVTGPKRALQGATAAGAMLNRLPSENAAAPGVTGPPVLGGEPPTAQELAQPFADVLGGVMESGELAILPAAIAAPWATAAAVGVGTGVTELTNKAATALGAPPAVAELAGDVTGLVAGGVAAHGVSRFQAGRAGTRAGIQDQITSEGEQGAADAAREHAFQEAGLQGDMTRETALLEADQAKAGAALADLHAKLALNEGLRQIAEKYKQNRVNPFEYLDAAQKQIAAGTPPPTPLELGPGTGEDIAPTMRGGQPELPSPGIPPGTPPVVQTAGGQDQVNIEGRGRSAGPPAGPFLAGQSGESPNIETAGTMAPQIATSAETPQPLIRQLGDQLEASLKQPGGPPQVELPPAVRSRLADQQHYQTEYQRQLGRMRDEMDAVEYQPGKNVEYDTENGGRGTYYTPPSGWAQVYHDVVRGMVGSKDTAESGPGGKVIRGVLRAFAETGGKTESSELTPAQIELGKKETGLTGPRAFKNAYDRWAPEAAKVAKKRSMRELARGTIQDRQTFSRLMDRELGRPSLDEIAQQGSAPPETDAAISSAEEAAGTHPPSVEPVGRPAPEGRGVPDDQLPDWVTEVQPGEVQPGEEPTLPGMEGVRDVENPTPPVAEAPFGLTSPTAKPVATQPPPSLFDALTETGKRLIGEEEGSLKLNVAQGDEPALRKWLKSKAKDYGDEEWFQRAQDAMEEGDPQSAWRIAAYASAQEMLGARSVAVKPEEKAAAQSAIDQATAAHRKQLETELGMKLPKSVDVSPEGIVTFPQLAGKGIPALRASATDLTMAHSLLKDITNEADPSQILRAGDGGKNKALQISSQIADQIVREMPDSVIHSIAELTGLDNKVPTTSEQRIEIARASRRAWSQAGKTLGALGNWTQENEEFMYQLNPVNETGAVGERGSVGALQAQGIRTGENFVQWLGEKATPENIKELGFELPKGIELKTEKGALTPEAKTYARNWFRRKTRLAETQKTIDVLAKDGNLLDRALVRSSIAPNAPPEKTGAFTQAISLSKAFLISKPSTMIRNAVTQGLRFAWGGLDDYVASAAALATGDTDLAGKYLNEANNLTAGMTRAGTNTTGLLKHPWAEGLEATYNYLADQIETLPAEHTHKFLKVLQDYPNWEGKFMGSLSLSEGKTGSPNVDAVRNAVTVLNRTQEHFFRLTVADAVFRTQLEEAGLNPSEVLAGDPSTLIQKLGAEPVERMIGTAVAASLDNTFAAEPIKGTVPDLLLNGLFRNTVLGPILQLGMPFPRFNFVSAPRWLWDHFPLAPITDLMQYQMSRARSDSTNMLRGRYYFMRQNQESAGLLLGLDKEIGQQEYDAAKNLADFTQAKDQSQMAARQFKILEAKASGPNGLLPEFVQPLHDAMGKLQESLQARQEAKSKWREAETRIDNLTDQRTKAVKSSMQLKEAGAARSPQEYYAQKFTGGLAFVAAYLLRQSAGALATKWYEYQLPPTPGQPEDKQRLIDLRAYAPQVQSLFLADVAQDIQANTDWSEVTPEVARGGPDAWSDYMRTHYTGKYTSSEFMKDALETYLSVSPAAGSTRDILSQFTGRTSEGEGVDAGTIQRALIGTLGEFIGRFSAPLGAISDVAAAAGVEGEATARIPEPGGKEKKSIGRQLVDPFLANIPGARQVIPEKVNPFQGEPFHTEAPLAHFFGVTERVQNQVEAEIKKTGTPVGAAVPRQTGDREFDNMVNRAYAKLLDEYFPQVLKNEQYQKLTPELKRDVLVNGVQGLPAIFPQFKKAAYAAVASEIGGEKVGKEIEGAGVTQKRDRWLKYLDKLNQEVEKSSPEPASEPDSDQPAAEPGAPPQL